ncbi:sulfate adenylyltransferase subunit CysN [Xylella taiwanensis]|nr:sulfate adenylyltransferase subunit CysN [Xylella taiwanensis]MCD8456975.1 sulfate adenylyltransferase subunit CysN [Xylella taiwanensis]MCD8459386.1 sulfate adenylyltransferase subunit CysN [Xylella taiwanensis]MCD8461743.1 sulfate adenylyltransferase subunit CysN [Xylella taiwanensis]MCD8462224.1 sulfate adenylyltransferase subunit CysN [Xylella taiwanensis]MCD8466011.1 sulfate adenylyltransferase subunit CysN [Xylella taiwanensis]
MQSVAAYLKQQEVKPLLRFITCGSVDDGKSTLIGHLLYDSKRLAEDQLAELMADSRRYGTQGEGIDYALLLDGLAAEREQGITIDVAYRYFDTDQRKFIVADCPGHAQYTRNMATGASTADAAVVLVDVRKGLLAQTRRHSYIVALLGIRHVVLAVNKMDLVGYDQGTFEVIAADYRALAADLGIKDVQCIPLSALEGDNLSKRSARMPWYTGPSLLAYLEALEPATVDLASGMCLPVQWVNRPDSQFRGFTGTLAAGRVRPGDAVVVLPSGCCSRVVRVFNGDSDVHEAVAGQAVTLTLADELDISRGDVIAALDDPPEVADQLAAYVLWMSDTALLPGRRYWLKLATSLVAASVSEIKHRVDVNTQEKLAARRLRLNEVGYCNLSLDVPVACVPYVHNRVLGSFILIDRQSNATVGAGTLDFGLCRTGNLHWQHLDIDNVARARIKGQTPRVLWFTGLSGAGKSAIANIVDKRLHTLGYHTFILDGDNMRHGLSRDLGFTVEDRVENIRRVTEVARLMADAGLIVLVSFISPFRAERQLARERFASDEFVEVFVDVPLAVAEARDVKGLYAKARAGLISNFTGIDSPYEPPDHPELHLRADQGTPEELAAQVLSLLEMDES